MSAVRSIEKQVGFLDSGGEMAGLIRAFDWSATPLGPLQHWPTSLRTTVDLLLRSPVPIVSLWGEAGTMIYNDAYSVFAGGRHPRLLGSAVREGWPEVADFNDNVMKVGLSGGVLCYRDQELTLHRSGHAEQVFMNLDYSPVIGESGKPIGVIAIVVETTGRVAVERELRDSEARFRDIADAAPVLIWLADTGKAITWFNRRALDFAGAPLEEVVGFGWAQRIHPDDAARTLAVYSAAFDARERYETQFRLRRHDGAWRMLDVTGVPRIAQDGTFLGYIGACVDVTEMRATAEALARNEARLRFLDTLGRETARSTDPDAILATTTGMLGRHLHASICAYADVDADEDRFTVRGDWTAPGSASLVGAHRLSTFGDRAVRNLTAGEPLILHDIGAELPAAEARTFQDLGVCATICVPLVKDGRLTALMAVHDRRPRVWSPDDLSLLTEVTERSWAHIERVRSQAAVLEGERRFREDLERRVAERTAELAQSEKNIRAIFETSHLYQGLLSLDGAVIYCNDISLSGILASREDILGKPFWETPWFAATPGAPDAVRAAVATVAGGESVSMPMSLVLPAGVTQFDFSMRPVKNDRGEVVALVPEAVDITARVKTEAALQQAQKMEAIGNLTGGIAHDFNNLLFAVLGSLELLRKRLPTDPALLRLLDNAIEGARRGSGLTERMLAFARRQDLKSERVDLKQLVFGMTDLLQSALGPMIRIEARFPLHLAAVSVDPNQLESALLNLAVNARDAMHGEGPIVIAAREDDAGPGAVSLRPGRYVVLSVADRGEGMDEATLKRATEPFFTTKGVGKGTGLGLSMVHGLAEQSGGTLVLRSTPGSGTTAEIWLPALAAEQKAPTLPAAPAPAPAEQARRLRILAVDDDALILMSTVDMLEDLGHEVVSAWSGKEALAHLAEGAPFDLVITDHAMPKMTGAQLAREIRAAHPDLPIILATGYAELPPGGDAALPRLSKPFMQCDLAEVVARTMAGAASGTAGPAR